VVHEGIKRKQAVHANSSRAHQAEAPRGDASTDVIQGEATEEQSKSGASMFGKTFPRQK
jgi:hypothetical protein